jgi:predicted ATPase
VALALEWRVLQEASVVGRTFWRPPVEHSLDLADVGRPLLALEARGLILARPTSSLAGQAEYAFKHALVREVAYASLTRARRARAHAAVGSWLEDVAGDRLEELAELLAYHYRQAADPQHAELTWDDPVARERVRGRAFACLLAASSAAQRRFALARALTCTARRSRLRPLRTSNCRPSRCSATTTPLPTVASNRAGTCTRRSTPSAATRRAPPIGPACAGSLPGRWR